MREVVENDIQIYTLALSNPPVGMKGLAFAEFQRGPAFMDDLAEESGVAYQSPDDGRSEQWHRIQVKIDLQKANVYAPSGFQLR